MMINQNHGGKVAIVNHKQLIVYQCHLQNDENIINIINHFQYLRYPIFREVRVRVAPRLWSFHLNRSMLYSMH